MVALLWQFLFIASICLLFEWLWLCFWFLIFAPESFKTISICYFREFPLMKRIIIPLFLLTGCFSIDAQQRQVIDAEENVLNS